MLSAPTSRASASRCSVCVTAPLPSEFVQVPGARRDRAAVTHGTLPAGSNSPSRIRVVSSRTSEASTNSSVYRPFGVTMPRSIASGIVLA